MKKGIAVFLAACLLLAGGMLFAQAAEEDISEAFIDDNFRAAVYEALGKADGESLSARECLAVTGIESLSSIASFEGIEYLPNLQELFSYGAPQLTHVDFSRNTELVSLIIFGSGFEALDVSHNTKLETLHLDYAGLKTLDVSMLPQLQSLSLRENKLTQLDLSANRELTSLDFSMNQLTELDLRNNPKIERLACYHNLFTHESDIKGLEDLQLKIYEESGTGVYPLPGEVSITNMPKGNYTLSGEPSLRGLELTLTSGDFTRSLRYNDLKAFRSGYAYLQEKDHLEHFWLIELDAWAQPPVLEISYCFMWPGQDEYYYDYVGPTPKYSAVAAWETELLPGEVIKTKLSEQSSALYHYTAPAAGEYQVTVKTTPWNRYELNLLSDSRKYEGSTDEGDEAYQWLFDYTIDALQLLLIGIFLHAALFFAVRTARRRKEIRNCFASAAGMCLCAAMPLVLLGFPAWRCPSIDLYVLYDLAEDCLLNSPVTALWVFCAFALCLWQRPQKRAVLAAECLGAAASIAWLAYVFAAELPCSAFDYTYVTQLLALCLGLNGVLLSARWLARRPRQSQPIALPVMGLCLSAALLISSVGYIIYDGIFSYSEYSLPLAASYSSLPLLAWCGFVLHSSQKKPWRVLACIGLTAGLLWTGYYFISFCTKAVTAAHLPLMLIGAAAFILTVSVVVSLAIPSPKPLRIALASVLAALLLVCASFDVLWGFWVPEPGEYSGEDRRHETYEAYEEEDCYTALYGGILPGDLVRINEGATYFDGTEIPAWVQAQNWMVESVNGDRVVIHWNEAQTTAINSPVGMFYLTAVHYNEVESDWDSCDDVSVFRRMTARGSKRFPLWLEEGETVVLQAFAGEYNLLPLPFPVRISVEAAWEV